MSSLTKYLQSFKEGKEVYFTAISIMGKYSSPCEDSASELLAANITLDKWRRLRPDKVSSLEDFVYSIGGVAGWLKFHLFKD